MGKKLYDIFVICWVMWNIFVMVIIEVSEVFLNKLMKVLFNGGIVIWIVCGVIIWWKVCI